MIKVDQQEVEKYIVSDGEPYPKVELTAKQWEHLLSRIDEEAYEIACDVIDDYICDLIDDKKELLR